MKKTCKYIMAALIAAFTMTASAQQVNTLYFLENAPMRHTINPAFQPVSKGYINFTPLGWTSIGTGNNSLTMSDIFTMNNGKTITPLHPDADKQKFLKAMRKVTLTNNEMTIGFLNMGFRVKENGFLTIGINERIDMGVTVPKSIAEFFLNGGMTNLDGGVNTFDLSKLGFGVTAYTEVGVGYSHKLNEKWTIGGKLKFLLGEMYGGFDANKLGIDASTQEWRIRGDMDLQLAGPFDSKYLTNYLDGKNMQEVIDGFKSGGSFETNKLFNTNDIVSLLTPSGYGGAIDFGFAYKPIENLQISVALVDVGVIYWTKVNNFKCSVDTTFEGAGKIIYSDPKYKDEDGNFSTGILKDTIVSNLKNMLNGVKVSSNGSKGMLKMVTGRLNAGLDANFWENRIGIGVVSATRLYRSRVYEEVTFGLAFRPVNWFNIAASYSLLDNGKYSNIGAGLSIMPYDGINFSILMDYIPTSYAAMPGTNKYVLPDKTKMFNIAFGFSICWGTNNRDKDRDGVYDKLDMCPETPRGVAVDEQGCPLDEDHDGVPDYQDHCLGTPEAAIGFVDSVGCELDTDGDGVEDYKDKCPGTPEAAWGKVDSLGCPLDTDGDGVPDYLDDCPETPEAAYGMIDSKGCPIDSDDDSVPDYLDQCPDTPEAARGKVDEKGCPMDSDKDGVPDYLDECPETPEAALGHVDEKGCDLDSDHDGVPDYLDMCPEAPGLAENKGCPEVKREVRQLLQKAMQGIEFETGKAAIKKKSYDLLDKIAQIFIDNSNYIIEVQGHTDNTGKYEKNVQISQQRADEVMAYLVKQGVPAERMTAVGFGPDVPVADNGTKEGRQKNRRVEFKITFEEVHVESVMEHAE